MDQLDPDSEYLIRRAREEQAAAKGARDPRARQAHIDLAERYSDAARDRRLARITDPPAGAPSAPVSLLQPEFRVLP